MLSQELLSKFRAEVFDVTAPFFWSNTEIFEYMNDAQQMFCRLTDGIPDSSSDVTALEVVVGEPFVDISPKILKIRRASLRSNYNSVTLLNVEDVWKSPQADYGFTVTPKLDNSTGTVEAMVLGMEQDRARLIKIPEAADFIDLVIYRLPLIDLTKSGQKLELAEHHHIHLLHWMKYRAYSKQDSETFDSFKAQDYWERFSAYCNQARIEAETRKHKYRTVQYGGI